MNKLLTKIVGAVLGTSMAVGVGTAVVAKSNKAIDSQVMAGAGDETTFTINITNINAAGDKSGDYPSSYSTSELTWSMTVGDVTIGFALANFTTGTGSYAGSMQNRTNNAGNSYIRSTTLTPGYAIKSVQPTKQSGNSKTWDYYGASSAMTVSTPAATGQVSGGTKIGTDIANESLQSFGSGTTFNAANYPYSHFVAIRTGSGAAYYSSFTVKVVELEADDPGKEDSSVEITNGNSISLNVGETEQLSISKTPNDALITFSSNSESVATVSETGLVTAVGNGSAVITATFEGNASYNGSSDSITVNVSAIQPSLVVGTIAQFIADESGNGKQIYQITGTVTAWKDGESDGTKYGNFYLKDSSGTVYIYGATADENCLTWDGVNAVFTWPNPSPQDFLTDDLTKTIVIGSKVTMNVTRCDYSGTKEGHGLVTNVNNNIPQISINGGNQSVDVSDTTLILTTTTANIGENIVSWSSSDESVAEINSSTGAVTPKKGGSTTITASVTVDDELYTATITLTVVAPVLSVGETIAFYHETSFLTSLNGTIGVAGAEADALVFTVEAGTAEGSFAFNCDGTYICYNATTGGNALHTTTTKDASASWTIVATSKTAVTSITNVGTSGRVLRYNTGSPRFACYTGGQSAVSFVTKAPASNPTYVTLSQNNLTLQEEASETLTFTTDSKASSFKWYSSNENVAEVSSSGVVTAKTTTGKANIIVYFDSTGNGSYDVEDTPQATCVVTVLEPETDYSSVTYGGIGTRITSGNASSLIADGKKIVLAYVDRSVIAGGLTSGYLPEVSDDVSFSNDNATVTVGNGLSTLNITVLTLEATDGGYFLKLKSGEYLVVPNSGSTGNLSTTTTKGSNVWTVEVDSIYGNAKNEIQFNSSANPKRFKTYGGTQNAIQLYSFVEYTDEALAYAETFLKGSGNSNTCAATISNWAALGTTFTNTLSTGAKNLFKYATHNPAETYTNATEYTIQHAVARYDDALLKHAELRTNEFMGREAAGTLSYSAKLGTLIPDYSDSSVIIIVIVSLVSLTTLGGYFLLRKRKEER